MKTSYMRLVVTLIERCTSVKQGTRYPQDAGPDQTDRTAMITQAAVGQFCFSGDKFNTKERRGKMLASEIEEFTVASFG